MPRRCFTGCFNLPCIRKECPAKDDLLDFSSEEDSPVKNDLPNLSSEDECPLENDLCDFTSEDLSRFTDQFSSKNLIGVTRSGKLYRGKMPVGFNQEDEVITKDVIVKILDNIFHEIGDHATQSFSVVNYTLPILEAELRFLRSPRIRGKPNVVQVIGCCHKDETMGVVYDLNPHDTLYNLIPRDDFTWLQRVNTALTLSCFLSDLHDRKSPYLIRNLHPDHVLFDQNFTPILVDFGMLVGGVVGNPIDESDKGFCFPRDGPPCYGDPTFALRGPAAWTVKSDVHSFGVLLLNLITKTVIDMEDIMNDYDVLSCAVRQYKPGCSFVHRSLQCDSSFDPCDGPKITKLAIQCVASKQQNRPTMRQVVKRLKALGAVQQHGKGEACGEKNLIFCT